MNYRKLDLLSGSPYVVNQYIQILQPRLRDIREYGENEYWRLAHSLTATSYDYRFQLDDAGTFYEDVNDYTIFCSVAKSLTKEETSILFGEDFTFDDYEVMANTETGEIVLRNESINFNLDESVYEIIVGHIRKLHNFERNYKRAGNRRAMEFYMKDERRDFERRMKETSGKEEESNLEPLISTLVNLPGFKYDYETVWDLKLYQFMDAVRRNSRNCNYNNLMTGIYTGNIDMKSIKKEQMNLFGEL